MSGRKPFRVAATKARTGSCGLRKGVVYVLAVAREKQEEEVAKLFACYKILNCISLAISGVGTAC